MEIRRVDTENPAKGSVDQHSDDEEEEESLPPLYHVASVDTDPMPSVDGAEDEIASRFEKVCDAVELLDSAINGKIQLLRTGPMVLPPLVQMLVLQHNIQETTVETRELVDNIIAEADEEEDEPERCLLSGDLLAAADALIEKSDEFLLSYT